MDSPPRLFKTRLAWRAWLARNHDLSKGLWLAYYKKASGKSSVTYEEALEEAVAERNSEQRFDHRKGYSNYSEDLDYGY